MSKLSKCVSDCSTEQMVPHLSPSPRVSLFPEILQYGIWPVDNLTKPSKFSSERKCVFVCVCVCVCMHTLICVQLFAIPWTVAHQAPLSKEFSRQEY